MIYIAKIEVILKCIVNLKRLGDIALMGLSSDNNFKTNNIIDIDNVLQKCKILQNINYNTF